jgi:NADH-quinone oxidoreductase subunit M
MLGAAYMLRLGQKLAWGAPTAAGKWHDLNAREWLYFAPLAVLVIYIGLAPGLTLKAMDPTLGRVLAEFQRPGAVAVVAEPARAGLMSTANASTATLPAAPAVQR